MITQEPPSLSKHGLRITSWRIERRRASETALRWYRLLAILVGLIVGAILLKFVAGQSQNIYKQTFRGTLGSSAGISNVLSLAGPLMLAGIAVAITYKMNLWNIGVEGQLFFGAWSAAALMFAVPHLNGPLIIFLMLLAAAAGGAAWNFIPGVTRAYLGVSEVITTLMLNFVSFLWLSYWAAGPFRDRTTGNPFPTSRGIPDQAHLPVPKVGTIEVAPTLIIGVVIALVFWTLFRLTVFGYQATMAGGSQRTGLFAGMKVRRLQLGVMLLSGAVGGLVGATEMATHIFQYNQAISSNTGYIGIVVAVLAGGSFLAVIVMALLFGAILAVGDTLRVAGVPPNSILALTGMLLLLASIAETFARYRVVRSSNGATKSRQEMPKEAIVADLSASAGRGEPR